MIDINLTHAEKVVSAFKEEIAEHYQYADELYKLDFTNNEQALYAIRKWLMKPINPLYVETPTGLFQKKEACRYCLTKQLGWANVWLPGIDGDANFKGYSMEHWKREMQKFYLLVWSELFPDDPYKPADLSQYRQRIDENFVQFPHMPESWGAPEYKPWI
jgi:hypothetical protein